MGGGRSGGHFTQDLSFAQAAKSFFTHKPCSGYSIKRSAFVFILKSSHTTIRNCVSLTFILFLYLKKKGARSKMDSKICLSIKSKKNPLERCASKASKGDFCARHSNTKIIWTGVVVYKTKKQKDALIVICGFLVKKFRRFLIKQAGPLTFIPEAADNQEDLLTLESVQSIPLKYRFSYMDSKKHVWMFDLRFLVQLMGHGNDFKNPFSQESLPQTVTQRLHLRAEKLRAQKIPILYVEEGELTPDQVWNQKVLDIFLKINSLGYGVNVLWFDMMNVREHERFYTILFNMWVYTLPLSHMQREILVPGYASGRSPLFRWAPHVIVGRGGDMKWWRKQNLGLMAAFLTRGQDKETQGCGALHILTALANSHRQVREAFPWLAEG